MPSAVTRRKHGRKAGKDADAALLSGRTGVMGGEADGGLLGSAGGARLVDIVALWERRIEGRDTPLGTTVLRLPVHRAAMSERQRTLFECTTQQKGVARCDSFSCRRLVILSIAVGSLLPLITRHALRAAAASPLNRSDTSEVRQSHMHCCSTAVGGCAVQSNAIERLTVDGGQWTVESLSPIGSAALQGLRASVSARMRSSPSIHSSVIEPHHSASILEVRVAIQRRYSSATTHHLTSTRSQSQRAPAPAHHTARISQQTHTTLDFPHPAWLTTIRHLIRTHPRTRTLALIPPLPLLPFSNRQTHRAHRTL